MMRLLPQLLLMGATLMAPLAHAATTTTEPPPSQHTSAHPRAKKIPTETNNTVSDNLNTPPQAPQVTQEDKKTKKTRRHPAKETPPPSPQPSPSQTTTSPSRSPAPQPSQTASPEGATARCKDGSFSHSQHHRGACSRHGGVDSWLNHE
ncbi:DUF3761 domain-containing protein [Enterobacter ludwigii]|uniref:DUF3761 domain-containing protein n=1 Tax=Enterobacter ludwigii TaxID=299767 RepID=UPI003BEEB10C